jgi:hypothetical protein
MKTTTSAPRGHYLIKCHDRDGNLAWEDEVHNLVTAVGKRYSLDALFSSSGFTSAWYVGLVDNDSYSAYDEDDTMASHAGWIENVDYDEGTRPTVAFSSASGLSKVASSAVAFSMNATATIRGLFMTTDSTKGGTSGTIYSVGDFTGGNKPVADGYTVSVTPTMSMAAEA